MSPLITIIVCLHGGREVTILYFVYLIQNPCSTYFNLKNPSLLILLYLFCYFLDKYLFCYFQDKYTLNTTTIFSSCDISTTKTTCNKLKGGYRGKWRRYYRWDSFSMIKRGREGVTLGEITFIEIVVSQKLHLKAFKL